MNHTGREKKTEDGFRGKKARRMRAAKALAAAGAIAGGTQAYAAPVRFDNPPHGEPGHFHWPVPLGDSTNWLNFTADAGEQPGVDSGPTSLTHQFYEDAVYGRSAVLADALGPVGIQVDQSLGLSVLVGLDSGDLVAGAATWSSYGYAIYAYYYAAAAFGEGVPKYLGLRFDVGSGNQYGWVGVVRNGLELDAFAWGHETDPGVPIEAGAEGGGGPETIPTVSEWGLIGTTLAMLAAGVWMHRKRETPEALN